VPFATERKDVWQTVNRLMLKKQIWMRPAGRCGGSHSPGVAPAGKLGLLAVARVNAVCERMNKLYATGPHALRVASLLNSVRGSILAAEARLKLLARKATVVADLPEDATRQPRLVYETP
jgi:hypothetical protein